jgi:hypothetical protein
MAETVQLQFGNSVVEVELAPDEAASRDFGTKTIEEAMEGVRVLAKGIQETLAAAAPDAMTVEFGLSIKGSGNFFIAKGETATNLKVTMQWKKG